MWKLLCSAAAGSVALVFLATPPFTWWRFVVAAAAFGAIHWYLLREHPGSTRSFWVLIGLGAVGGVVARGSVPGATVPLSPFFLVVLFAVLLFLVLGIARVLFTGAWVRWSVTVALAFLSALTFFLILDPLLSLDRIFLIPVVTGLFLALALPFGELLLAREGTSGLRPARVEGYAAGFLGVQTSLFLALTPLHTVGASLLLVLLLIFLTRVLRAAGRGTFTVRGGLSGLTSFLLLATLIFALWGGGNR